MINTVWFSSRCVIFYNTCVIYNCDTEWSLWLPSLIITWNLVRMFVHLLPISTIVWVSFSTWLIMRVMHSFYVKFSRTRRGDTLRSNSRTYLLPSQLKWHESSDVPLQNRYLNQSNSVLTLWSQLFNSTFSLNTSYYTKYVVKSFNLKICY